MYRKNLFTDGKLDIFTMTHDKMSPQKFNKYSDIFSG